MRNMLRCTRRNKASTRYSNLSSHLPIAMAAGRAGDTLVVTRLDLLVRSLPGACDILD